MHSSTRLFHKYFANAPRQDTMFFVLTYLTLGGGGGGERVLHSSSRLSRRYFAKPAPTIDCRWLTIYFWLTHASININLIGSI